MICESTDFAYPLLADVYYPIVDVGAYGNVKKQWVLDKTIACYFSAGGLKNKKDVNSEANLNIDNVISGRVKSDLTQSTTEHLYAITNIIVTNIRDINGTSIYNESAGIRSAQPTIFEIATFSPVQGPFGTTEHYKVLLRRSENQAVDL